MNTLLRRLAATAAMTLLLAAGAAQAQLPPASGIVINQTPVQGGSAGQCLFINNSQISSQACGGAGTVTSVSVTTANGVSGSVATATTTPAISLTLGAITPSSVNGNTITTGSGTLTLGAGKTATISNTLTFAGTDGSTLNVGTGGTLAAVATSGSASDLSAGTLASARGGAGTITGALKGSGAGVVSQAACADLSNGATGCSTTVGTSATVNTGTSGATIPLLNAANNFSGVTTVSNATTGTPGATTGALVVSAGDEYVDGSVYVHSTGGATGVILDGPNQTIKLGSISAMARNSGTGALTLSTNAAGIIFAPASAVTTVTGSLTVSALANAATTSAVCYNVATGVFTYNATIGTCTVSDEGLKDIQGPIDNALDRLLKINGFYYTWKNPSLGAGRQIGVGAQTVEAVFPELVATGADGVKSVDYQRIAVPIIEALRELKIDNDRLRRCQNSWKCRIFGME